MSGGLFISVGATTNLANTLIAENTMTTALSHAGRVGTRDKACSAWQARYD
jgi:hypothetical protein